MFFSKHCHNYGKYIIRFYTTKIMRRSRMFWQRGSNFEDGFFLRFFFFFVLFLSVVSVDEGRTDPKYHYKRAVIDPPAKRHLNGVLLAFR